MENNVIYGQNDMKMDKNGNYSYKDEKLDGLMESCYQNGQEVYVKKRWFSGIMVYEWKKETSWHFKNGEKDGLWERWYENS